jgi:hypothetical protein
VADQADTRGLMTIDPEAVTQSLLRAIQTAADRATMSEVVQEMDDAGKAALAFTQALVLMDPSLGQHGVPLAHDAAMQDAQLAAQRQQARDRAAAPTPAKGVRP